MLSTPVVPWTVSFPLEMWRRRRGLSGVKSRFTFWSPMMTLLYVHGASEPAAGRGDGVNAGVDGEAEPAARPRARPEGDLSLFGGPP
jgi:hypothetical protein